MRKLIAVVVIICAAALVAYAAGPAKIDLGKWVDGKAKKKAVQFPHDVHQAKNQCTDCHMTAEGGALKNQKTGKEFKPMVKGGKTSNDVHKEFCWDCHKKKSVPKGKSCSKCHK